MVMSQSWELGTEQLVGADVLIGPQRRNNVHRVVLAFRRDRDIPPYRCERLSPKNEETDDGGGGRTLC